MTEEKAAEAAEQKKPEKPKKKPERHGKEEKEKPKEDKITTRVRVSGVILDGNLDVSRALTGIKGVGLRVSKSLLKTLGIKKGVKLSSLSEKEVGELENAISSLHKNLPQWMLNRQKDYITGENMHLVGPELDISQRGDIDRQKKIRSYKGIRHSFNQPVRGQRTRSSFRTGGTLGVTRKKEQPAKAAAPAKDSNSKKK